MHIICCKRQPQGCWAANSLEDPHDGDASGRRLCDTVTTCHQVTHTRAAAALTLTPVQQVVYLGLA